MFLAMRRVIRHAHVIGAMPEGKRIARVPARFGNDVIGRFITPNSGAEIIA
jgi:hypothetical protein